MKTKILLVSVLSVFLMINLGISQGATDFQLINADVFVEGQAADESVGHTVFSLGDVNADGQDDVAICGRYRGEESLAIFLGRSSPLLWRRAYTLGDADILIRGVGESVASGDVDGDGINDVACSASGGGICLFFGRSTWRSGNARDLADVFFVEGSVVSIGNYNADKTDINYLHDVVITSLWSFNAFPLPGSSPFSSGSVSLFLGRVRSAWLSRIPAVLADVTLIPYGPYGNAFGPAFFVGDINGDGYEELSIQSRVINYYHSEAYGGHWRIDVFGGRDNVVTFSGNPLGDLSFAITAFDSWDPVLSYPVSTVGYGGWGMDAGDLNGDGYDETLIQYIGKVDLLWGRSGGIAAPFSGVTLSDAAPETWASPPTYYGSYRFNIGIFSSSRGDVNGDGFSDLLVGSGIAYKPAYLILGRSDLISAATRTHIGPLAINPLGTYEVKFYSDSAVDLSHSYRYYEPVVSIVGDLDGDSLDDIVVAEPGYGSDPARGHGRVSIIFSRTLFPPSVLSLSALEVTSEKDVLKFGMTEKF